MGRCLQEGDSRSGQLRTLMDDSSGDRIRLAGMFRCINQRHFFSEILQSKNLDAALIRPGSRDT